MHVEDIAPVTAPGPGADASWRLPVLGALLVAAVAGILFLQGLDRYPLWDPDEARHAEVAREMAAARGVKALLLPQLEFEPYREKPAPFYWLLLATYRLGGVDAGSARAVSALAALAAVLAVYAYAVGRVGVRGAVGASLVLATSIGWYALARFVNLDMVLTALVTAGVLSGLAWLERPPPRSPPLLPYLAAALGTLVKGPLAAALVAGPLVLVAVTRAQRPRLGELGLGRGLALAAAVLLLFWVPVASIDTSYLGGFASTNLRRFGAASPHPEPPYYYLIWLPVLFFPWVLLAPLAIRDAVRDPARRPLVAWAAFVPMMLTLARGKVATYALSALVPLALIVGPELARVVRDGPRPDEERALRAGAWVAVALLGGTVVAAFAARARYPVSLLGCLLVALAALGWALALGRTLRLDGPRRAPALILGAALMLYLLLARVVMPAVSTLHSDRDAARLVAAAPPGPVIAYAARAPSLVFYLRSSVVRTEDLAFVASLFARDEPVYLVAGHRHWATLERRLGARAHAWYSTPRRRLYANRPPPANGSS